MTIWTDALVEDLKRRWAAGESAAFIGADYGVSRNVVLGKVYRLKLEKRGTVLDMRQRGTGMRQVKIKASPLTGLVSHGPSISGDTKILRSKVWEPLPGSHPVLLHEHTLGCKWLVEMPEPGHWFCNEPNEGEGPYCRAHHTLSIPKEKTSV